MSCLFDCGEDFTPRKIDFLGKYNLDFLNERSAPINIHPIISKILQTPSAFIGENTVCIFSMLGLTLKIAWI